MLRIPVPAKAIAPMTTRSLMETEVDLPMKERAIIYAEVKRAISKKLGDDIEAYKKPRAIYWAIAAQRALMKRGVPTLLQAGVMAWSAIAAKNIGSKKPDKTTHIQFRFDMIDNDEGGAALEAGMLPEMHVWLVIPKTDEIVDFSTGELVYVYKEMCPELVWDKDQPFPPPYAWFKSSEKKKQHECVYRADAKATMMANLIALNMYQTGDLDWLVEQI